MKIEFEITNMRPASDMLETGSEVVALFDVEIFPFRIRDGQIRKRPGGELWVTLPGRKTSCIWISEGELIEAIRTEARAFYMERFDGQR
ncbi:hypothetical protein HJB77_27250 [Rhizobium lentis]|uniref:hypothetical protein n=1 Tax=Rhizobium lentis TaxID=1138194 RepID=UPI001C831144|nr:hypothetical protein [Rhizobium lentis]MBX5179920.1 hypothetical protein [Rhizobium lentis]